MTEPGRRLGDYSDLAYEYYESTRHPTSANFRDASKRLLATWFREANLEQGWVCEVGAGRSLAAELLRDIHSDLNGLLIADISAAMLSYSAPFADSVTRLVVADAASIPVASASMRGLISILGDPYNEPSFWSEALRVLEPGGVGVVTFPSFDWIDSFRSEGHRDMAEFEVADKHVSVRSVVRDVREQQAVIESSGLCVDKVEHVQLMHIAPPISPKLILGRGPKAPVVTGYFVSRPLH